MLRGAGHSTEKNRASHSGGQKDKGLLGCSRTNAAGGSSRRGDELRVTGEVDAAPTYQDHRSDMIR